MRKPSFRMGLGVRMEGLERRKKGRGGLQRATPFYVKALAEPDLGVASRRQGDPELPGSAA